jgi:MATE family multidrug resistance protein
MTAYWLVGMPLAWGLAFRTPLGADGLWWGLTASLAVAAAGLSVRFARLAGRAPPSRARLP